MKARIIFILLLVIVMIIGCNDETIPVPDIEDVYIYDADDSSISDEIEIDGSELAEETNTEETPEENISKENFGMFIGIAIIGIAIVFLIICIRENYKGNHYYSVPVPYQPIDRDEDSSNDEESK